MKTSKQLCQCSGRQSAVLQDCIGAKLVGLNMQSALMVQESIQTPGATLVVLHISWIQRLSSKALLEVISGSGMRLTARLEQL